MSIASAEAFIQATGKDKEFLKKVVMTKDNEERKKIVKAAGFDFTLPELQQAGAKLYEGSNMELSSEDLDRIAAACIGTVTSVVVGVVTGTVTSVVGGIATNTIATDVK